MSSSIKIAIASGHHNTTGGNHEEIAIVGPIVQATIATLRGAGADVLSLTPGDGLGMFPGRLDQCAAQVVQAARRGWRADLFLEIHGEANGQGDRARGAFIVYPDWPSAGDLDTKARDHIGPALVRALQRATGTPQRGTGTMSERSTAVGASGHRLGIFAATAAIRAETTRLILECGSYTSPADRAIMYSPGYAAAAGRALAEAIVSHYAPARAPGPASPPASVWRQYRITARAGAKLRAKPATGATRTLQALSYGAPFSGQEITGEAYSTPSGQSRIWIKHSIAGYVRGDLVART